MRIASVAVSASGNILISGLGGGSTVTLGTKVVDADAGFVAVYDAQGNQTWLRKFTASGSAAAFDAKFDPSGNVIAVGSFAGMMTCATDPCPTSHSNNYVDPVVRKYDGNGTEQWTHHYDAVGGASAERLGIRSDGHFVVAGAYFNSVTLVGTTYTNAGDSDVFVVEAGPSGDGGWAFSLGSGGYDLAGIAMRPDDSFILAGSSGGPLSIGGVSTGGPNKGGAFAFSFDQSGAPQWAKSFAVTGGASAINDVATDAQGNFVVAGWVAGGTADFGGGQVVTPANDEDAVIVKFGSDGSFLWGKTFGGAGIQTGNFVAMNASGQSAFGADIEGRSTLASARTRRPWRRGRTPPTSRS